MFKVLSGDCREVMAELEAESVDSVVCDPPYELGFMGKSWDASGVAFDPETWRHALRVLKPGGHLLAFSGSRTYHRMACAIEDAGFEIRDQIMWVYGSGFPKSHDVSKAIDREAGAEREVVGQKIYADGSGRIESWPGGENGNDGWKSPGRPVGEDRDQRNVTAPATDAARTWSGWGTALKPAHEPIVVARKPFKGTVAANVLAHGTAALNIDGCRVVIDPNDPNIIHTESRGGTATKFTGTAFNNGKAGGELGRGPTLQHPSGRWPANFIHDGSDEVLRLFPETAPSKAAQRGAVKIFEQGEGQWIGVSTDRGHDDAGGSAARFFYCPKASKRDREDGLDDHDDRILNRTNPGGIENDPKWAPRVRKNNHPTVKPTDLMRYLCRLVTPPGGLVLDPFTGSGSTGRGAVLEGFRFLGIEMDPGYREIAIARIESVERSSAHGPS